MPIFTAAVVTPTQGSLETAIEAYVDANSAANTVAVYANNSLIQTKSNLNFNNSASIIVTASPNGANQVNITFGVANSLGIGTYSPNANLHVVGNTLITTDLIIGGNLYVEGNTTTLNVQTLEINDNELVLNANTTGAPSLNATITIDRGTSPNTFIRWNESIDRWGWSDDGSTFYTFNQLLLKAGDTMTGQLNVSAGGLLVTGNSNFDSGTLFVDSVNDRVGVGVTTPTSSLHVAGSGNLDGGSILLGASSVFGKLWLANTSLGTNIDNTRDLLRLHTTTGNADSLDFFKLRDGAGSSWDSAGWRIQEKVDATWMGWMQFNGNGLTGGISFGTGTNTTSPRSVAERMRINNDGNVGIGTTSPGVRLDVTGTVRASSQLISTVATGTSPLAVSSTTLVTNLNADLLDGLNSTDYMRNFGMLDNTDQYVNFRVMRNSNPSSLNDGMFIGYGNSGSGVTRIFGGGATSGELIKYSTYSQEPGSFRAPIFYDSDNTNYYVNAAGYSNLNQLNISRDGSSECCSGSNYTLSLAEATSTTGKLARIQFHNAGVSEGFIALAGSGTRRILFGDFQSTTMGIEATGKISSRNVLGNTNVGTAKTLVPGEMYMVSSSGQTVTLPASPVVGDTVGISVGNFTNTIVGRNGQNIMGLAEDMTVDLPYSGFELRFVDATYGWRIV